ncbi:uncharacterized protein BP5553_00891 [Venustampulla echinocandica]|uniref:Cytochrome P450 n=1 Tax=Venustampulla echinocandica TaxID=2656787 RepID=A0A370TZF7_9HELO|nr:uncharacterized protein BP5553_00891 [Venustampulla echinocandica]RDL40912.1 hypothetical protein BP5553_00891 [Venustampulla echinocandica]
MAHYPDSSYFEFYQSADALLKLTSKPTRYSTKHRRAFPKFESILGSPDEDDQFLNWTKYKTKTDGTAIPHVKLHLSIGFAAIATTATALVSILHELAANTDLVEILRNEIEEVSPQGSDFLDGGSLSKLLKMDSLMKGSQRIYPFTQVASIRELRDDITLEDGKVRLKRGSACVAANSATTTDPRYYCNDPNVFDPLRFYKLRTQSTHSTDKYKFTAINHELLPWGYGRHACPSRFLAHDTMKITLALLITKYDIRLSSKSKIRPPPWRFGHTIIPDPTVEFEFKSRKV